MKETIIKLLRSTEREGVEGLIQYLSEDGFFEAPASTKFHGCYTGGLAKHSFDVYKLLKANAEGMKLGEVSCNGQKPLPLDGNSLIIAALLHDVTKIGAYIGTEKPYQWNKSQPEGHATLSIERIKKFIKLTKLEEMMIRFHMGIYATYEFHEPGSWSYKKDGEYHLRSEQTAKEKKAMSIEEKKADQERRYGLTLRNAWYHNPVVKLMCFCDEIATLEEKAKE